jgi:hypothetical protein
MNHMGLVELAQIREQEHMREALRRQAIRAARRDAGVTWLQLVRARLFGSRPANGRAKVPPAQPAPPVSTPATPAAPVSSTPAPTTRAVRVQVMPQTPQLRAIRAAEVEDCVTADC